MEGEKRRVEQKKKRVPIQRNLARLNSKEQGHTGGCEGDKAKIEEKRHGTRGA